MIEILKFIDDLKEIRKSMPYTNITSELVDSKIKKYENMVEQFEKDNEVTITGIVITENNKPLEYATVTIKDSESSDIITGGLTDKNGQFSISAASGVYHINDLSILSGNKKLLL